MRYLLINNNLVENVIEADETTINTVQGYDTIIKNATYGIGCRYMNGEFEEPIPIEPERSIILTQLEFLRLFTAEERIVVRLSTDSLVVDFLYLLNLAQDVKLDDPDTIAGVNYLESLGLLAEGRAAEILT